jgi:hypothetical protein
MADTSGILGSIFNSPRRQRQFFILSAAVLIAGVATFLSVVVFRGTGNAFTDTFSNQPAVLNHPEKKVPVSKAQLALARKFIQTAVMRKDLSASYDIVDVDLKGRMTRHDWVTGDIPVILYEARNAKTAAFIVDYSYETSALLEVDLVAKPHTETRPHLLFFIGLKRAGGKKDGRWLVDYWQPHWRPPIPSGRLG